jgi:serine phosphatase RsbU (regulator of sigma subunit)
VNNISKYSEKTLRFFIVIITLYCLVIGGIPVFKSLFTNRLVLDGSIKGEKVLENGKKYIEVTNLIDNGVAESAGFRKGDIILTVNGNKVDNLPDLQRLLSNSIDKNVSYEILRGNEILHLEVNVYRYFHFIFYVFAALALGFLINGFFVGFSKPREIVSIIFFLFGTVSSLGFFLYSGVWYYVGSSDFLMLNYFIAGIFIYPLFFHFFSVYPTFYEFRYRKLIIWAVYTFSVFLNAVAILDEYLMFLGQNSTLAMIISYSPFAILLAGLVLFIKSYMKIRDERTKKSLRILLTGLFLGIFGMAYYFILFILIRESPNMNILYRLPVVLVLGLPVSFGISIYKYKILDTEFIVKKGIVYSVASVITGAAYFIAINFLDTIYDYYHLKNKQSITIITIILVIFSFSYITKLISSFVDRKFYRSRYNYRKSLLEFSSGLPYLNNINEVEEKIRDLLSHTMGIKYLKIQITHNRYFSSEENINNECIKFHKFLFSNNYEPKYIVNELIEEAEVPEEYSTLIRDKKLQLILPVILKDDIIGAIDIGAKRDKVKFTEEDIDLLKTLASNVASVFENSRLRLEEIKKNKIEEELKVAKNIQMELLPATEFSFSNLEISCASAPARIIGGDFYDVIRIDENNILVVIADVSGKGLPAALYMAKVQALIRFAAKIMKTPKDILIEVNKQVYEKFDRKSFVTVSLGQFNLKDNSMRFVRAGHNPAIFAKNGSIELLNTRGMGLGLDGDEIFSKNLEEHVFKIEDGSLVLFYTDGLNEAMNKNNEEFGMERLINTIKHNRHSKSKEIRNELINEISRFSDNAEQHDDITLVVVKTYKK